jgi:hypothetical protein
LERNPALRGLKKEEFSGGASTFDFSEDRMSRFDARQDDSSLENPLVR